jgi:hypothetical protein
MTKQVLQFLSLVFVVLAVIALPAGAQQSNYQTDVATPAGTVATSGAIHFEPPSPSFINKVGIHVSGFPVPVFDPKAIWKDQWICRSAGPAEVTGFRVQCGVSTFLDFHIADCCVPGDHWQLKGKAWDLHPNTGVTTSPGPVPVYSVPGRIYNYGGTAFNRGIDAYVECSYLTGVNLFLADSFVAFSSDGACVVTPDPVVRRIDRTP